MDKNNLVFIKDATWDEVFDGWQSREASEPGWIECATKIKGWPDWKTWRQYTASGIKADSRKWTIYKIINPQEEIPQMLVGPYTGWQNRLPQKNVLTFAQMLDIPKNYKEMNQNDKVLGIANNFPSSTQFIGLKRQDTGQIVCFEGHHRAVAVALAGRDGRPINLSGEITLALADLETGEEKLLDETLVKGSQKP